MAVGAVRAAWSAGAPRLLRGVRFPLVVFVVWRCAHAVVDVLAGDDLVGAAFRWDALANQRIFTDGYYTHGQELRAQTAFFPFVSWLAHVPDLVLPARASQVLTANVLALASFVTLWAVAAEWRDERVARRSVLVFALWPASLFLWAFYGEAAFVATSAGAVWADRRGRRWLAALLLAAAATARPVGVLFGAAVAGLRVWRRRRIDTTAVLYAAAAAAGLALVMAVQRYQAGDALAFVHSHEDWGMTLAFPWVSLREGIGALKSGQPRLAKWLDLGGILAMLGAVVWAAWPRRRDADRATRLPVDAWVLTAAIIVLPLCSRLLSSMNRYVLAAWPGFVIIAAWLGTTRMRVRAVVYGVLAVASVLFVRYWADGTFIG